MGCCSGCEQPPTTPSAAQASGDTCTNVEVTEPGHRRSVEDRLIEEIDTDDFFVAPDKAAGAEASTESCGSDDCCKPAAVEELDSCSTGDQVAADFCGSNSAGGCCDSISTPVRQICAEKAAADVKIRRPACCTGKPAPCCDTSCLDRIAARECQRANAGQCRSKSTPKRSDGCGSGKPCSQHKQTIRSRYAARLEALECICSALIALGQASCCLPTPRSSLDRKRGSKTKSRVVVDDCCSYNSAGGSKACQKSSSKRRSGSRDKCARNDLNVATVSSCEDTCCERERSATPSKRSSPNVANTDPEKGASGFEHVIFSVSGMTCTGCETKLSRTLGTLATIKDPKTSLVLSRVEFDLDKGASSVAEVIAYMQRTTEFKFERVNNHGSTIDVIPKGNLQDFLKLDYPAGVTEMSAIDKRIVRVLYDAKIIGARDLLNKGFGIENKPELAAPQPDSTLDAGSKHVRQVGYMTLFSAVLTIPVLVLAWAPLPDHEVTYGAVSLALATIIQFVVAGPFYPKCLKALIFSRVIEMDLLIVLSTTTAYIFSVTAFAYMVSGRPLSTKGFFETSTLLVTLIMVGRWVSAFARQRAVESISIRSLQVSTAILVGQDGKETEIDSRLLQYGDSFKVLPESRIPTDGTVVSGSSEVDESMITGESSPVEKSVKSPVIAGSVNGSGVMIVRLSRLPGENTITAIAHMVDEAKLSKPNIQETADKVASYFVPAILVLTIITFVIWIAVGLAIKAQSGSEATINAITYAITVLIVSCPCAVGLAVPMVIVMASGIAAERGVIFKSSEAIEVASRTSHVVFDKTGTLTQGKLAVVAQDLGTPSQGISTESLLLGLLGSNKHPVSAAVATHLKSLSILGVQVDDIRSFPGKGVEGKTPSGQILRAGNSRWLNVSTDSRVSTILDQGFTSFCFTIDGSLAAVFGLEDSLRSDALETVTKIRERGITVSLISGDDEGAVRSIAAQLGILDINVQSRCTPADKQEFVKNLLTQTMSPSNPDKKPKTPVVIFCGDGTNDAVALAQATIGIHMNEGSDVAQSAADVVLMRPNLLSILTVINTSRVAVHRIAFNFAWSLVYNIFAILLAAGAFVHARIPPEFAGLGEVVSVLPVIIAAVLLRWSKI
ncbi:E1-E2 ATPase-domain-containing protein [Pestalotiopsis sp. NC0098]|nr:E1-E2 ATPase-domain-containing protein [Pestalotiopsis sp. NC0098]